MSGGAMCGRSEHEWQDLEQAGWAFLEERQPNAAETPPTSAMWNPRWRMRSRFPVASWMTSKVLVVQGAVAVGHGLILPGQRSRARFSGTLR